ncbi:hypothetical protein J6590_037222 [Homalodisca vitripennis]|nr:hypothetical protein J6590_037222 [Homalodisca vitripennis]
MTAVIYQLMIGNMSRDSVPAALLCLTLVILVFVSVSGSPAKLGASKEDLLLWERHRERLEHYRCGEPRPTVVPLPSHLQKVVHIPEQTVLHRCNNSGCCPRGRTCKSSSVEKVKVAFLLPVINDTEGIKGSQGIVTYVDLSNDTACACVETQTGRRRS